MDDVLEVTDLSVRFGQHAVFSHLTFSVPRGAALALVGPNGAGKTMLFRTLLGAVPFTGHYRWAEGVRIGYVPQHLDIARDVPITGSEFLRAREALARGSRRSGAEALALVGLPRQVAELPIGAVSGGQFQRLLIAFALVGDPNVLLLDEPTAGVDEPGEERLNELVQRLQRQQDLTVLQISHDLSVVNRYASLVVCLGRGVVCVGKSREILTPQLLQELYGTPIAFHIHEH
jgi:zinc transport system ATP-binding protein